MNKSALGDTCLMCCQRGKLTAHHVRPFAISHDDNRRNLVPLCLDCHRKVHATTQRLALWIAWLVYAPLFTWLRLVAPFRKPVASEVAHQQLDGEKPQREIATILATDLTDVAIYVALDSGRRFDLQKMPDGRYMAQVFASSKSGVPVTMAQASNPMQALQLAGLRATNTGKRIALGRNTHGTLETR